MTDIRNKADVKIFVDAFYEQVRIDPLIGAVFAARIAADAWPAHLERMYSFWHTVLFGVQDYRGNPFSKHSSLPIHAQHFERWIQLLSTTIDAHFAGPKAEEVKLRAQKMGLMFQSKLAYLREHQNYKNIL